MFRSREGSERRTAKSKDYFGYMTYFWCLAITVIAVLTLLIFFLEPFENTGNANQADWLRRKRRRSHCEPDGLLFDIDRYDESVTFGVNHI